MRPCASGRASSARASPTRSGAGSPVLETNGTWTVCHEHISRAKEVWRCTRDEGRPLEVRSQVPASNPCKLRSSRAIVVSVAAKGGRQSRQVRSGEASESELLRTCRNAKGDVKTGGTSSFRDQVGGCPEDCPSDIRHGGGAKPDQALVGNVRTCRPDAKGDVQAALCCTGRGRGRTGPYPVRGHAMRTDSGCPSSSMRLSAWTPTLTSVTRRRSVRACSPSPITRLYREMAASARARAL